MSDPKKKKKKTQAELSDAEILGFDLNATKSPLSQDVVVEDPNAWRGDKNKAYREQQKELDRIGALDTYGKMLRSMTAEQLNEMRNGTGAFVGGKGYTGIETPPSAVTQASPATPPASTPDAPAPQEVEEVEEVEKPEAPEKVAETPEAPEEVAPEKVLFDPANPLDVMAKSDEAMYKRGVIQDAQTGELIEFGKSAFVGTIRGALWGREGLLSEVPVEDDSSLSDSFFTGVGSGLIGAVLDPNLAKRKFKFLYPGTDDKSGERILKQFTGTRAEFNKLKVQAMNLYGLPKRNGGVAEEFWGAIHNGVTGLPALAMGATDLMANSDVVSRFLPTGQAAQAIWGGVGKGVDYITGNNPADAFHRKHMEVLRRTKQIEQEPSMAGQELFTPEWFAGGVGSIMSSFVQFGAVGKVVGAAGKASSAAKYAATGVEIAPALLNTLTRYGTSGLVSGTMCYNDALNAGLDKKDAAAYALTVGAVMATIESANLFSGDQIRKFLIGDQGRQMARAAAHELSGAAGIEAQQAATLLFGRQVTGAIGKIAAQAPKASWNTSKVMMEEGATEGLQSFSEQLGQVAYNMLTDRDMTNSNAKFDIDGVSLKQVLTETFFGAIGGGLLSPLGNDSRKVAQYVSEGKAGELKAGLDLLVADGTLSAEQKTAAIEYIDNLDKVVGENRSALNTLKGNRHEKVLRGYVAQILEAQYNNTIEVNKAKQAVDDQLALIAANTSGQPADQMQANELKRLSDVLTSKQQVLMAANNAIKAFEDPDHVNHMSKILDEKKKNKLGNSRQQNQDNVAFYQPPSSDINAILTRESDGQTQAAFQHVDEIALGLQEFQRESAQAQTQNGVANPLPGLEQKLKQDLIATRAYLHPKINTDANRELLLQLGVEPALLPMTTEQKEQYEQLRDERIARQNEIDDLKAAQTTQGNYGVGTTVNLSAQPNAPTNQQAPQMPQDVADRIAELEQQNAEFDALPQRSTDYEIHTQLEDMMNFIEAEIANGSTKFEGYAEGDFAVKKLMATQLLVNEQRVVEDQQDEFQSYWHNNDNLRELTSHLTREQESTIQAMLAAAGKPIAFRVEHSPDARNNNVRGFFNPRMNVVGLVIDFNSMQDAAYRDKVFAVTMHELRHAVTDEYVNQLWRHWTAYKKGAGKLTPQVKQFQRLLDLALLTQKVFEGEPDAQNMYYFNTIKSKHLAGALLANQGETEFKDADGNVLTDANGKVQKVRFTDAATLVKELFSEAQSDIKFMEMLAGFNMNSKANKKLVQSIYNYKKIENQGVHSILQEIWDRLGDVFSSLRAMLTPTQRTLFSESVQLMDSLNASKFNVPALSLVQEPAQEASTVSAYLNSLTGMDFTSHFSPVEILKGDIELGDLALTILNKYQTTVHPTTGRPVDKLQYVSNPLMAGNPDSAYENFMRQVTKIAGNIIAPDFRPGTLKVVYFNSTDQLLLTWTGKDGSAKRQFIRHTGEPVFVNSNPFNRDGLNTMSKPNLIRTFSGTQTNPQNLADRKMLRNLETAQEENFAGKIYLEYDPDHAWDNNGVTLHGQVSVIYETVDGMSAFPIGYMPDLTKMRLARLLEGGSRISLEVANLEDINNPNKITGSRALVKRDPDYNIIEYVDYSQYKNDPVYQQKLKDEGYVANENMAPSLALRFTEITNSTESEAASILQRDSFTFDSKNMVPGLNPMDYLSREDIAHNNVVTPESDDWAAHHDDALYNPTPFTNPELKARLVYYDELLRRLIRRNIIFSEEVNTAAVQAAANSTFNRASDRLVKDFPEDADLAKYFGLGPEGLAKYREEMVMEELKRVDAYKYKQKGGGWQGEGVNPTTTISAKIRYDLESIHFTYNGVKEFVNYREAKTILLETAAATDGLDEMLENLREYSNDEMNFERNRVIAQAIYLHMTSPRPEAEQAVFEKAKNSYWMHHGSLIRLDAATIEIRGHSARVMFNGQSKQEGQGVDAIVRNIWENVRRIRDEYEKHKQTAAEKGEAVESIVEFFNDMTGESPYAFPRTDFMTGIGKLQDMKRRLTPEMLGSMGIAKKTMDDTAYAHLVELVDNYFRLLGIDLPTSVLQRQRLDQDKSEDAIVEEVAALRALRESKADEALVKMRNRWRLAAENPVLEFPGGLGVEKGQVEDLDFEFLKKADRFIGTGIVADQVGNGNTSIGRLTMNPEDRSKVFNQDKPKVYFSRTAENHSNFYKGDGIYTLPGGQKVMIKARVRAGETEARPYMIDDIADSAMETLARGEGYISLADMMSDTRPEMKRWTTGKIGKYFYDITPVKANSGQYAAHNTVAIMVDPVANTFDQKEVLAAIKAKARILTRSYSVRHDGRHTGDKALGEFLTKKGYIESGSGIWENAEVIESRQEAAVENKEAIWTAAKQKEIDTEVANYENGLRSGDANRYKYHMLEFERKEFDSNKRPDEQKKKVFGYRPYMEFYAQMIDLIHEDLKLALDGKLTKTVNGREQPLFSLSELKTAVKMDLKRRGDYNTPEVSYDAKLKKHWAYQNKSFTDLIFERFAKSPKFVRLYQQSPMYRLNIILDQFANRGRHLRPILVSGVSHPTDKTKNINYAQAKKMDYLYMNLAYFSAASQKEDGGTYYYHIADVPSDKPRAKAYPLRRIPRTEWKSQLNRIKMIEETRQRLAEEAFVAALQPDAIYDENGKEVFTRRLDAEGNVMLNKHGMPFKDYQWSDEFFVVKDEAAFNQLAEKRDFVRAKNGANEPMVNAKGQPVYQRGSIFNTDDMMFPMKFENGEFIATKTVDQVMDDFAEQFKDAYEDYISKGGVIPVADNTTTNDPINYLKRQEVQAKKLTEEYNLLAELANAATTDEELAKREKRAEAKLKQLEAVEKIIDDIKGNWAQAQASYSDQLAEERRTMFREFSFNHLINRYHLSMLTMGDYAFYKGGDEFTDMSKRATDAPAQRLDWGKDHWGTMIAIRDIDGGETPVELPVVKYNDNTKKWESTPGHVQQGATNRTDAQGYITEQFDERLKAAAGVFSELGAPYKPVLFGHNPDALHRAMPLYLKLSFTVLPDPTTEDGKDFYETYPKLKEFAEKLYDRETGADFALFESGIKTGLRAANNYGDSTYKSQRIDLRQFGIQNNPKHLIDEDADIARGVQPERQLGDNNNFLFNEAYGMFESYQILSNLLHNKSKKYFKEVLGTPAKVYESLKNELLKRDHTKSLVKQVGNRIRLDNPSVAKYMESMVNSGLFRNTSGMRKKGMKLVNVSDLGLTRPRYQAITLAADEGDYKAGDVVYTTIPGQDMELMWMGPRKAADLTHQQLVELNERIKAGKKVFQNDDPSSFIVDYKGDVKIYPADMLVPASNIYSMGQQLVATRSPSSGKNSIVPGAVAGFLPEKHGNVIAVGSAGPYVMGFDFDIDGFFTWHKNEDPQYAAVNKMFDIAYNLMLQPRNYMEATTPVDPGKLKALADRLDDMAARRAEAEGRPARRYSKFTFMRQLELKELNSIGKDMISTVASVYGMHSVLSQMGVGYTPTEVEPTETREGYLFDDRSYAIGARFGKVISNRKFVTTAKNHSGQIEYVFDYFMRLLNGATDNAKHQFLGRLGLNSTTMPIVLDMIGHGIDLEYAIMFVNQPIIEEYVDKIYRQGGIATTDDNKNAYLALMDHYQKKAKVIDPTFEYDPLNAKGESLRNDIIYQKKAWGDRGMKVSKADRVYIPLTDLEASLEPVSAFGTTPQAQLAAIRKQMQILEKFDYYGSLASTSSRAGKLIGVDSGFPATFLEMNDIKFRFDSVLGVKKDMQWKKQRMNLQNVVDRTNGTYHPYYSDQYDRIGQVLNWFSQYNLYAKPSIIAMHNDLVGGQPMQLQERVKKGFYAYVLAADERLSPKVLTGDPTTAAYTFIHEAANLLKQLQLEIPNNYFLQFLTYKPNYATDDQLEALEGRPDEITFNQQIEDGPLLERIQADWHKLPETYDYNGRPINVKNVFLANLAMTKGFEFSGFTYARLLPEEIQLSFDQYLNEFEDLYESAVNSTEVTRQNAFLNSSELARTARLEQENNPFRQEWLEAKRSLYRMRDNAEFIEFLVDEYDFDPHRLQALFETEGKIQNVLGMKDFKRQAYLNNPKIVPMFSDRDRAEVGSKQFTFPGFSKVDFDKRVGTWVLNPKILNWDTPMHFTDKQGHNFVSVRHAYMSWVSGKFDSKAHNEGFRNATPTPLPSPLNMGLLTKMMVVALKARPNRGKAASLLQTGMKDLAYKPGQGGLPTDVLEEVRAQLANEPWFKNGWEGPRNEYIGGMRVQRDGKEITSIQIPHNSKSVGIANLMRTLVRTDGIIRMNVKVPGTNKIEAKLFEAIDQDHVHFSGTYGLTPVLTLVPVSFKAVPGTLQYQRNFIKSNDFLEKFAMANPSMNLLASDEDETFEGEEGQVPEVLLLPVGESNAQQDPERDVDNDLLEDLQDDEDGKEATDLPLPDLNALEDNLLASIESLGYTEEILMRNFANVPETKTENKPETPADINNLEEGKVYQVTRGNLTNNKVEDAKFLDYYYAQPRSKSEKNPYKVAVFEIDGVRVFKAVAGGAKLNISLVNKKVEISDADKRDYQFDNYISDATFKLVKPTSPAIEDNFGVKTGHDFRYISSLLSAYVDGDNRAEVLEATRQLELLKYLVPEHAYELLKLRPSKVLWRSAEDKRKVFKAAEVKRIENFGGLALPDLFAPQGLQVQGFEVQVNGERVGHALLNGDHVYQFEVVPNYEGSGVGSKLLNEIRKTMPETALKFTNLATTQVREIGKKLGIAERGPESLTLLSWQMATGTQRKSEGEVDSDSEYSPEIVPSTPRPANWKKLLSNRVEVEQLADGDMNKCL